MRNQKGQNVIEYVILVVAVVVVAIGLLSPQSKYKNTMENSFVNGTIKMLENTRDEIQFNRP